jgi:hypothetical protein
MKDNSPNHQTDDKVKPKVHFPLSMFLKKCKYCLKTVFMRCDTDEKADKCKNTKK